MENNENTVVTDADDWSDIDLSDAEVINDDAESSEPAAEPTPDKEAEGTDTTEEAKADPAEASKVAEPVNDTAAQDKAPEADQSFTVKHLDETVTVSREQAPALLSKGLDYDRVRGKYDEATSFIKEMAENAGMTSEQFVENARASILAKKENISVQEAVSRLRIDRREKEIAAREKALEEKSKASSGDINIKDKITREASEFFKAHPDMTAEKLPKEVLENWRAGTPLIIAYTAHENAKLKAENEALKKAQENKTRSTGTAASAKTKQSRDAWDSAWYNGD